MCHWGCIGSRRPAHTWRLWIGWRNTHRHDDDNGHCDCDTFRGSGHSNASGEEAHRHQEAGDSVKTRRVHDPTLTKGTTQVTTRGVAGVRILTYEVTITNGVQTAKRLISKVVTRAPVTRVIAVGTKEARQCDPNYSGACVPIASDVDCAGGSGNGPAYVQGPVRVVGTDIYGLDADGDGIGCDS
jgi:hypothetical protein